MLESHIDGSFIAITAIWATSHVACHNHDSGELSLLLAGMEEALVLAGIYPVPQN